MSDVAITRTEQYLNGIAEGESVDIEPVTRKEFFLAKAAGMDVETPDPVTREEIFLSKISGSSSGGSSGGDEKSQLDALIEGSITEISSDAEKVVDYALASRPNLTSADFPVATSIGNSALRGCANLTSANFPVATSIGIYALYQCTRLTSANFPVATSIGTYAFTQCEFLTSADFPVATSIESNAFYKCARLESLVLRSETVATLSSTNAFNNTPIKSGTGYIYVPAALVDTYKAATNWSTYADQFRALEDYTVDGTITGELDESKI